MHRTPVAGFGLLLAACSTGASPSPPPVHYAALPTASKGGPVSFAPTAELSPLALTCRAAELPDNGLDDDCDGHIDRPSAAPAQLVFCAAHTEGGELELALVPDDEAAAPVASSGAESKGTSAAVSRLELHDVPQGTYAVRLHRRSSSPSDAPITTSLGVENQKGVQLFLATLKPGETLTLGEVVAP